MENNREHISCDIETAEAMKGTHFYEDWFSEDQLSYTSQGPQKGVDLPPFETFSSVGTELARRNPDIATCDIMLVRRNANKMGEMKIWDVITLNTKTLELVVNSLVASRPANITVVRKVTPIVPDVANKTDNNNIITLEKLDELGYDRDTLMQPEIPEVVRKSARTK